jgi:class 3 adenylate cyclase
MPDQHNSPAFRVGRGFEKGHVVSDGQPDAREGQAWLDFTIIGRAVNEAARLQNLTKQLKQPVLASATFVAPISDRFEFGGEHRIAGFCDKLDAYRLRL